MSTETKITHDSLQQELDRLVPAVTKSIDSCLVAKYIAISDSRVRDLLVEKSEHGYPFKGAYCKSGIGIPENVGVVFEFDCIPGTFCLIPPSFLVTVNIVEGRVDSITDPYIPSNSSSLTADGLSFPFPGARASFPTHSWSAIADLEPPKPNSLKVHGLVTTPTPGYAAVLRPPDSPSINETILMLDLTVQALPGTWIQKVSDIDASYLDKDYQGIVETVIVTQGGTQVANIKVQKVS